MVYLEIKSPQACFSNQKHSLFTGEQPGRGPPAVGAILAVVVGEVGRQDAQVEHSSDKAHQAEWEILNTTEERERRLTL